MGSEIFLLMNLLSPNSQRCLNDFANFLHRGHETSGAVSQTMEEEWNHCSEACPGRTEKRKCASQTVTHLHLVHDALSSFRDVMFSVIPRLSKDQFIVISGPFFSRCSHRKVPGKSHELLQMPT